MPDTASLHELILTLAAFLMMLAPMGAAALESGLVRAKNSVNPTAKAVMQVCVAVIGMWVSGLALAAGTSLAGIVGSAGFFAEISDFSGSTSLVFMLYVMIGVSLVGGAGAERMTFAANVALALLLAAMAFPTVLHWVWHDQGLLRSVGFKDQAGGAVVCLAVGGAALAVAILLGPRSTRSGRLLPGVVQSQSFPFVVVGMSGLWLSFLGLALSRQYWAGGSITETLFKLSLGSAGGAFAGMALHWFRPETFRLIHLHYAAVGGTVALLAGVFGLNNAASFAIGVTGGALSATGASVLARWKIDDGTAMVPAHLFSALLGLILAGLDRSGTLQGTTPSLIIQLTGGALIAAFCFSIVYGGLSLLSLVVPLRVSTDEERQGLNSSEHGVTTDLAILISQMTASSRHRGTFVDVDADPASEFVEVAREFNLAVDSFREQVTELKDDLADAQVQGRQKDARIKTMSLTLVERDSQLELAAREVSILSDQLSRSMMIVEGLNARRDGMLRLMKSAFHGPLATLQQLVERASRSRNPQDVANLIDGAQEQSALLASRLDNLLAYANTMASDTAQNEEALDVGALVNTVSERLINHATARNVTLKAVWDPDLPALKAERAALRKMMVELASHGLRVTEANGRVLLAARMMSTGELAVEMIDSGPALTPGQLAAALDPISDGNGTTPLGLALCKALADRHEATFVVRSRPQGGNKFTVQFPKSRLLYGQRPTGRVAQ